MSAQTLENPKDAIVHAVGDVRSSVGDAAQTISKAFMRSKDDMIGQVDAQREAVVGYMRNNPGRSVGIAAVVGLAIGLLMFRR